MSLKAALLVLSFASPAVPEVSACAGGMPDVPPSLNFDSRLGEIRLLDLLKGMTPVLAPAGKPAAKKVHQAERLRRAIAAPQEDWACQSVVVNRSGTIDSSCAAMDSSRPFACYEEMRETCVGRATGETKVRDWIRGTGVCGASYADCW